MPYPYITQSDLETRLSPAVIRRVLDDANVGAASAGAVERVIRDASAKVAGFLREPYSLDAIAANTPEEVKRLTLDVAHAYLCRRHPEVVKGDWPEMLRMADRELTNLNLGKTRLDVVGPPEPHQNIGRARVTSGSSRRGWDDDCF